MRLGCRGVREWAVGRWSGGLDLQSTLAETALSYWATAPPTRSFRTNHRLHGAAHL